MHISRDTDTFRNNVNEMISSLSVKWSNDFAYTGPAILLYNPLIVCLLLRTPLRFKSAVIASLITAIALPVFLIKVSEWIVNNQATSLVKKVMQECNSLSQTEQRLEVLKALQKKYEKPSKTVLKMTLLPIVLTLAPVIVGFLAYLPLNREQLNLHNVVCCVAALVTSYVFAIGINDIVKESLENDLNWSLSEYSRLESALQKGAPANKVSEDKIPIQVNGAVVNEIVNQNPFVDLPS